MGRTSAPPQNFGSSFGAVQNAVSDPQPPQRQYTPNPFAANRPPPGPLPPGLSAGPPGGMSPEEWNQYKNAPIKGKFFGRSPEWIRMQLLNGIRSSRQRRANSPLVPPTQSSQQAPNRQAMMAMMLRNGGGMR